MFIENLREQESHRTISSEEARANFALVQKVKWVVVAAAASVLVGIIANVMYVHL
ncbi:hypothetical protein [Paraburkholderia sp. J8-2]|uniref:hypothetical protein n=1 Tax=Paraburkholderia sp. J8-2 TaxID=2805440 RepID=UPI002AB6BA4E|nr:hypothetical protein [Paraburkholderia sp. J8-2]